MRRLIHVTGIVQGVGFRPFIYRIAKENKLKGYVKNRGDAGVEILVEGNQTAIEQFLHDLPIKKPPLADLYSVKLTDLHAKVSFDSFFIDRSSTKTELQGSVVPPDIAICRDCLDELRSVEDRRYDYFFITCTNCGPRFTIIERLPYDRENTTMRNFQMCRFCKNQYSNPQDRRFYAQTVACPKCGPKTSLQTNEGKTVETLDPIRESGRLLSEGKILAIKGFGGFHIAASVTKDKPLVRLRQVKHRSQKPFAIMVRSLDALKKFADVSNAESELLSSHTRPIVLVNKRAEHIISDLVAPGLHNVGVMLPYTGLHYMLFDKVDDLAFVMTSANPPNQPIIRDDEEALKILGDTVDYFLFHDRRISQRCDDSVTRVNSDNTVFIRRSRGYTPAPIMLKTRTRTTILALGAELNNTACLLNGDKAFLSQHIGDVENVETKNFLENSTNHLIHLTNSKVERIACDLHPQFTTSRLAEDLSTKNEWNLFRVQHHYAHAAALMAERQLDEVIAICCDGYGYGDDGKAWGGEVLLCRKQEFGFERLGHLQEQPMVGGDLAATFPMRMILGILREREDISDWYKERVKHLPHGQEEVELIERQLKRIENIPHTTSCGRILDAVSALLDVCHERTYEGEPSMKLESAAMEGQDLLRLTPVIESNSLNTSILLETIFEHCQKLHRKDLAFSAHKYLASGLAELAIDRAREKGIDCVGFTGGVASNTIMTSALRSIVEKGGLRFVAHERVPPGDGGVSLGQAFSCAFHKE